MSGIRGMFSANDKTVYDLEQELGQASTLVEINVTNPDMKAITSLYNVDSIPYMIVLYKNKVEYRGIPSEKVNQIIAALMNPVGTRETETYSVINTNSNESDKDFYDYDEGKIVTIAPGQHQFTSMGKDDSFYFGDNEPKYEELYYKDPMNGGLIDKSNRVGDGSINRKTSTVVQKPEVKEEKNVVAEPPQTKLPPVIQNEPPPKRIDIDQKPIKVETPSAYDEDNTIVISEKVDLHDVEPVQAPPPPTPAKPTPPPPTPAEPVPPPKPIVVVAPPPPEPKPEPKPIVVVAPPPPPPEPKTIIIEKPAPPPIIKYVEKCSTENQTKKEVPEVIDTKWEQILKDEENMGKILHKTMILFYLRLNL